MTAVVVDSTLAPTIVKPDDMSLVLEGPEAGLATDPHSGARLEAVLHRRPVHQSYDEDLIPEVPPPSEHENPYPTLKQELRRLGIVEAYRRWCGKCEPQGRGPENIIIRCPFPDHPDENPSAWMNSDKGTGNCAMCGGFDTYDLWAMAHGYPVPSYRDNKGQFKEVVRGIAGDLGLEVVSTGGVDYVAPQQEEPEPEPRATVTALPQPEEEPESIAPFSGIPIDWRTLLNTDETSFLRLWMDTYTQTDLPEEFWFWTGLLAVSMAVGNDALLEDQLSPVRANLMVCLLGYSGMGKTRTTQPLFKLLRREQFAWRHTFGGVEFTDPESSQSLHAKLVAPPDPTNPTAQPGDTPVRLLVKVNEFSAVVSRSRRTGSTIKQALQELFDSAEPWGADAKTNPMPRARDHFVCAITTSQPTVLGELLDSRDARDGFLNRWVYATGIPKVPQAFPEPFDVDEDELERRLKRIRDWTFNPNGGPRVLRFSREARALYTQFFDTKLRQFRDGSSDDSDAFVRIELMLKKLALLLAANAGESQVTERIMSRALDLYDYLYVGYQFVAGETLTTQEVKETTDIEERVLKTVKKHQPCTFTTIQQYTTKSIFLRLGGPKAWQEVINRMVDLGQLVKMERQRKVTTGRAPTPLYVLPTYQPEQQRKEKP
jgi:hypothetical protein